MNRGLSIRTNGRRHSGHAPEGRAFFDFLGFARPDPEAQAVLYTMTTSLGAACAWGVLLAWGALGLVACGGNAIRAGESASGGSGSTEPPPMPGASIPPLPDVCAKFQIEYADSRHPGDSTGQGCAPINCPCTAASASQPADLINYSPIYGCVSFVDCSAACAAIQYGQYQADTCSWSSCENDGDCASGVPCVVAPGSERGICQDASYNLCADASDCPSGVPCVAVAEDGTRRCTPTEAGQGLVSCNTTADCASGHCALPDGSFLGNCTTGQLGEHCERQSDCLAGMHCAVSQCTDGSPNSSCTESADCRTGYCAQGACNEGKDGDFCNVNDDCQSKICVYGIRCSSGAIDATCASDADCLSGRCALSYDLAACTSGAPGSKCLGADDCVSNNCVHVPGANPDAVFGTCG
jgi:hypothetical protein